ncbi:MAG: DUF2948 family protein [Proteobacteria bacterium]|nr:DUF2948 family protein [Pseudomonadota bacterium]MDA1132174.1 DUF2948 family protein [Pseudomonadota bacterium]
MKDAKPLRLTARDAQDLLVVSACLQDAITRRAELVYRPRQHRFAATFNRFRWESGSAGERPAERVRAGVHFDSVLRVQTRELGADPDELLQLLAIRADEREDGVAELLLEFAGSGSVRLEVECIDCYLSDLGEPWPARRTPKHPATERDE